MTLCLKIEYHYYITIPLRNYEKLRNKNRMSTFFKSARGKAGNVARQTSRYGEGHALFILADE